MACLGEAKVETRVDRDGVDGRVNGNVSEMSFDPGLNTTHCSHSEPQI